MRRGRARTAGGVRRGAGGHVLRPYDRDVTEPATLTVYGASWCADCRRSKAVLDTEAVDYRWIDVDAIDGAAGEALAISGRTSIPLIVFPDGSHLVEPSDGALRTKLATV